MLVIKPTFTGKLYKTFFQSFVVKNSNSWQIKNLFETFPKENLGNFVPIAIVRTSFLKFKFSFMESQLWNAHKFWCWHRQKSRNFLPNKREILEKKQYFYSESFCQQMDTSKVFNVGRINHLKTSWEILKKKLTGEKISLPAIHLSFQQYHE